MTANEGEQYRSPADLFDEQTVQMTDFHEYMRVVAQEGIPALLSLRREIDTEEELDERFIFLLGFTTHRVLENRRRAGLSIDQETILGELQGLTGWMTEFIVEPEMKRRVGQGILQGLYTSKVVPPPWETE